MTSTLGSDIRKNINQARAIYSLLKFRNGLQRHMGICVTGVYADMLITQNLGSILPPGTTSSLWPSLSLPYCSLLVYKSVLGLITVVFFLSFFLFFFFFLRLTFSWSFVKSQLQANLIFIQVHWIKELEVNCYLMSPSLCLDPFRKGRGCSPYVHSCLSRKTLHLKWLVLRNAKWSIEIVPFTDNFSFTQMLKHWLEASDSPKSLKPKDVWFCQAIEPLAFIFPQVFS